VRGLPEVRHLGAEEGTHPMTPDEKLKAAVEAKMDDPITNRFQVEIGGGWQLLPSDGVTWREWAFDPFFGLTLPGQILKNPRTQVPKIQHWVDEIGEGRDPKTGMKNFHWVSRAFWLRFGIRVLGLDIGFSAAWRKKAPPVSTTLAKIKETP
jgi:hypothetical protein